MKLQEAIQTLATMSFRIEEFQKQLVDLHSQASKLQSRIQPLLKDAEALQSWAEKPTQQHPKNRPMDL